SPLVPEATTLPVRASFVPWIGHTLAERLSGDAGQVIAATPGQRLRRPLWADGIETSSATSSGASTPLGEGLIAPASAGTYFLTRLGRRVGALVVNAPADESVLDRWPAAQLSAALHADESTAVSNAAAWSKDLFRGAARRSLVGPALALALLALLVEMALIGV